MADILNRAIASRRSFQNCQKPARHSSRGGVGDSDRGYMATTPPLIISNLTVVFCFIFPFNGGIIVFTSRLCYL